jgi:transcriptional regulator with XRE-family HTH domain
MGHYTNITIKTIRMQISKLEDDLHELDKAINIFSQFNYNEEGPIKGVYEMLKSRREACNSQINQLANALDIFQSSQVTDTEFEEEEQKPQSTTMWITAEGEHIPLQEMSDQHLTNAVRCMRSIILSRIKTNDARKGPTLALSDLREIRYGGADTFVGVVKNYYELFVEVNRRYNLLKGKK